jgi:hypothetical protein
MTTMAGHPGRYSPLFSVACLGRWMAGGWTVPAGRAEVVLSLTDRQCYSGKSLISRGTTTGSRVTPFHPRLGGGAQITRSETCPPWSQVDHGRC